MGKFHINKQGIPAPCKAKKGNCPLGGEASHFDSQEEAQEYINNKSQEEFGLLSKPVSSKMDRFERLDNIAEKTGHDLVINELALSLSNDELNSVVNEIVDNYDLEDYLDEDDFVHDKLEKIQEVIGADTTLKEMSQILSADRLEESMSYMEENLDIKSKESNGSEIDNSKSTKENVNYEEELNDLRGRLSEHTKNLIEDVEKWLDDTEI